MGGAVTQQPPLGTGAPRAATQWCATRSIREQQKHHKQAPSKLKTFRRYGQLTKQLAKTHSFGLLWDHDQRSNCDAPRAARLGHHDATKAADQENGRCVCATLPLSGPPELATNNFTFHHQTTRTRTSSFASSDAIQHEIHDPLLLNGANENRCALRPHA